VLQIGLCLVLEFRDDALGKDLPQFHSPLIEGIDLPDSALGKDAGLVECNKFAQRRRSQLLQQNRVGRPIAVEGAMRRKPWWRAVRLDLLRGLAES
jgi:hypothetical protein